MPSPFDQHVIDTFRARGGRVGPPFEGAALLLLTTTGARTGRLHTTPVGRLTDDGGRALVIASAGGAPDHPQWFTNLLADPHVTVEDGTSTWTARAVVLEGPERDAAFARAAAADPGWTAYQEGTTRVLPVVALERR
ncbi:nitroreductase/quinone reductase family protein [Geodermatophilus sp. URMC 62]|uniref:nitroreductase/quinone reductase family protein n=1 Tax=Geodermatophilus sp. URMC 62 TaxID=3423414 RepID=UPI00406CC630